MAYHAAHHMQRGGTLQLVWGLFNNQACTCEPFQLGVTQAGWNPAAASNTALASSNISQIAFGWAYALLLTTEGSAYAAEVSKLQLTQQDTRTVSDSFHQQQVRCRGHAGSFSVHRQEVWQQLHPSTCAHPLLSSAATFVQIAAGDLHCLLLDSSGCVWAFGDNKNGQLGVQNVQAFSQSVHQQTPVLTAEAGQQPHPRHQLQPNHHSSDGTRNTCHSNAQHHQVVHSPVPVLGHSSSCCQERIKQVAAGSCHSVAVTATFGRLYCWGWNAHGQCGLGSTSEVVLPTLCSALDGVPLACAAAGMAHTVVASKDGAVYSWGWNCNGQLGLGCGVAHTAEPAASAASATTNKQRQLSNSLVPVLVEHPVLDEEHVVQVACGSRHTVALTESGRVFTWGLNKHGQCCAATPFAAASPQATTTDSDTHAPPCTPAVPMAAAHTASHGGITVCSTAGSLAPGQADLAGPFLVALPDFVTLPQGRLVDINLGRDTQQSKQRACEGAAMSVQQQQQRDAQTGARKLLKCGKALGVLAGRWHTCIFVESLRE